MADATMDQPEDRGSMDTLHEVMDRLTAAGFVDDLIAQDGMLVGTGEHDRFDPDDVVVVEMARFEGESDPGDEAIVFAVASEGGDPIGTYSPPYGSEASTDDIEVMTHLTRRARS